MVLISCDPGLHGIGYGIFVDGTPIVASYTAPRAAMAGKSRGPHRWREVATAWVAALEGVVPDVLVLEQMIVRDQRAWRGRQSDVLEVQGVVGAISMAFPSAELHGYIPDDWKGSVPTDIFANRVEALIGRRGWSGCITPGCPKDRRHDMMHGFGLGLHHLGIYVKGREK